MPLNLTIPASGALDFLSLGALVHRLDPGIIPFRKAHDCAIHVSGGEFNVAANLADAFGMKTGICSAMSRYPIGDLIAERITRHRATNASLHAESIGEIRSDVELAAADMDGAIMRLAKRDNTRVQTVDQRAE